MKKTRGIIDSITLGFLVAIGGSALAVYAHSGDKHNPVEMNAGTEKASQHDKDTNKTERK